MSDSESEKDLVLEKETTPKKSSSLKDIRRKLPWSERYRPQRVKDIMLGDLVKKKVQVFLQKKNIENIIICGATGQGKSCLAKCLSRELQKTSDNFKTQVLELNSSNDRGVKAVDEIIIPFCKKKTTGSENVTIKHIIFDEADNMTDAEQQKIAQLMETFSKKVKFIFTCNQTTNIIPPIQTRCLIFRLSPPTNEQLADYLEKLLTKKKIKFTKEAVEKIAICTEGDIRRAVNLTHVIYIRFKEINLENVKIMVNEPPSSEIQKILSYCRKSSLKKAIGKLNELRGNGYSQVDLIGILFRECAQHKSKNEINKINMLAAISKYYIIIKKYVCSELQLNACIAECCLIKDK